MLEKHKDEILVLMLRIEMEAKHKEDLIDSRVYGGKKVSKRKVDEVQNELKLSIER